MLMRSRSIWQKFTPTWADSLSGDDRAREKREARAEIESELQDEAEAPDDY